MTSVRRMPWLASSSSFTFRGDTGSQKLGQPVPDSNFDPTLNKSVPQQTHWKKPVCPSAGSEQVVSNGRSVPFRRVISYCSGVSCAFHSASVLTTFGTCSTTPVAAL
jgi:hypothetical protein